MPEKYGKLADQRGRTILAPTSRLTLIALSLILSAAAVSHEPETVLTIAGRAPLPGTIGGTDAMLRVDPGGYDDAFANPSFIRRSGIAGREGCGLQIGPVDIPGGWTDTRIRVADKGFSARLCWVARPIIDGADAEIGPDTLPHQVIRFNLRLKRKGEQIFSLPLVRFSRSLPRSGMGVIMRVGGNLMPIYFTLNRRETLATAGAGTTISAGYGGTLTAASIQIPISAGVMRPTRIMQLARPLQIGPLSINRLHVRVVDWGTTSIAKQVAVDPDEILVQARSRRNRRNDRLVLGSDALDRCSSLTIDKAAMQLLLSCT